MVDPLVGNGWLTAQAQAKPDGVALHWQGQEWTYVSLEKWVQRCAGTLREVFPSLPLATHVAILAPNCPEYVCLIHAFARLGWVLVPLNSRLTVAEWAWQLENSQSALLLYHASLADKVAELPLTVQRCCFEPLTTVMGEEMPALSPSPHPLQAIVYTSGTTGQPKGAMISFANHFYSAIASASRLGVLPNDYWLSCLPLYHVGGLAVVFRSCLYGTTIDLHAGFELEAISHSLATNPITLISLVPTMLYRLLKTGTLFPATMRAILLGGAAATPELLAEAIAQKLPVALTYGLTEAASQVATIQPEKCRHKPGSVGKPLLFTQLQIVNEQGQTIPNGQIGEIVVTSPTVMAGYWANSLATAQTIRHGQLFTGDMGYFDQDGDLWVVQRRTDLIISGGENIYPTEVEALLRQHPAVAEACVVGLPHAEWGQQPAAMVVLREGFEITPQTLQAYCRQHLAPYKQPRAILLAPALPLTASGKVARQQIIQQLVLL